MPKKKFSFGDVWSFDIFLAMIVGANLICTVRGRGYTLMSQNNHH